MRFGNIESSNRQVNCHSCIIIHTNHCSDHTNDRGRCKSYDAEKQIGGEPLPVSTAWESTVNKMSNQYFLLFKNQWKDLNS